MDEKVTGKKTTFTYNEKQTNRASKIDEEQRKEKLRISREKDREPRGKSSDPEDHEKQRLATLKRLKPCDENDFERKLRLEKVVVMLAVETEEERKARLEKMVATTQLR